ncbi:myrosinase 1-like [Coccinella septempunctata]|uniref:myrosinase 1-like n=1 Tax=Coccinella septempunctata TaxID=41139 RepID=UPI001D07CABC|nr:myrosinase 1-like [Coccinella septempunctata]
MVLNLLWMFLKFLPIITTAVQGLRNLTFPNNFKFGVATSAYQIEGAWNEDGKGQSIWDHYLHKYPYLVKDKSNGDIACDSYHKYKEDVKLLKDLGVDFYRFSIAWTRIIPMGYKDSGVSLEGIEYYNNLIDELLASDIEPYVTIFHWDTPKTLEENGGWLNNSIVDHYVSYARILFELYGDRVKHWLTFNEFSQFCEEGYSRAEKAPFKSLQGIGGYQCTHNALIAHSRTYKMYVEEFKISQKGFLGLSVDTAWAEPKTDSILDKLAAEEEMLFSYFYYLHPLIFGDYPTLLKMKISLKSSVQGFRTSRLPKFNESEIELLRGSFDFIGLNHYTTALCSWSNQKFPVPSELDDCGVKQSQNTTWKISAAPWLAEVPWGLRKLLVWIKEKLNNPPLLITENGWATTDSNLDDNDRMNYHTKYLSEVLKAIHDDDCNVIGYTAWTLMDNFEWMSGYGEKFGLVQVDLTSTNRTRTPKDSFFLYQKIIRNRKLIE